MDQELKQRLIGASVIIALAVIFIPMLFDSKVEKVGDKKIDISIPEAGKNQLIVKSFSLDDAEESQSNEPVSLPESEAEIVDDRLVSRSPAPASGLIETVKTDDSIINDETIAPIKESTAAVVEETVKTEVEELNSKKPQVTEVENNQQNITKPKQTESIPVAELDSVFRVKLGSFSQAANAQQVRNKLAQEGIDSLVEFASDLNLYRVWSQSLYQDKLAAEKYVTAVNRLKLNLGEPKIIAVTNEEVKTANAAAQLGWVVQLGSFSDKANALDLRNRAKLAGFAAFVDQIKNNSGEVRYRLRVGPFNDQQQAQTQQQQINEKLKLKGLVQSHELATLVE